MNWPLQHPRTPARDRRRDKPYVTKGWGELHQDVVDALNRLAREADAEVRLLELSTGHDSRHIGATGRPLASAADPQDPGVVVWFSLDGETTSVPCDGYTDPRQNVRAIIQCLHQQARSARDGVGTVHALFQGFKALPARTSSEDPRVVEARQALDAGAKAGIGAKVLRQLQLRYHPDNLETGDRLVWDAIQEHSNAIGLGRAA